MEHPRISANNNKQQPQSKMSTHSNQSSLSPATLKNTFRVVNLRWLPMLGLLLFAGLLQAAGPTTINVTVGGNQLGVISVDVSGNGVAGTFSTLPNPPNAGSLAAAAALAGEDHFNWYQIVTADNQPPKSFAGVQLAAPYVDVPPGGYAVTFDNTWGDNLPWYYDEGPATPAAGQVVKPALSLANNTTASTLSFGDFPGGPNGLTLTFKTWLVSLNADSSFHAFEGGFSWGFSKAANGTITVTPPAALGANPVAAEYANLIGGFATSIPEPSTLCLLALGALALVTAARRRG